MNIWVVNHYAIPPALGGLNRHYYFSKNLKKEGHVVRIFSSSKIHNTDVNLIKNSNPYKKETFDDVEYTFIKTSDYRGNGLKRIFTFLQFPWNVLKTIKKFYKMEKPDIIYASSPELFATWIAVRFAKKNAIPLIVEIRDLWPESVVEYTRLTRKNPIIKLLYVLERKIYEQADRIIFTFEGGKDYIIKKKWDFNNGGKIDIKKVRYVNNGVDLKLFNYDKERYVIDDDILDSEEHFKVVYTGSVRHVNCVWMIVEAAKKIKEKGISDIDFVIYGNGTEKDELVELCSECGLNNVYFRDRVDKKYVPGILNRADMNIFVGEDDSMNQYGLSLNKMFDYMASGKPTLSNISANYDNLKKFECGIVVKSNSVDAIADGIIELKDMPEEKYNKMCENALEAAKTFDYETLSKKLEKIFLEIK